MLLFIYIIFISTHVFFSDCILIYTPQYKHRYFSETLYENYNSIFFRCCIILSTIGILFLIITMIICGYILRVIYCPEISVIKGYISDVLWLRRHLFGYIKMVELHDYVQFFLCHYIIFWSYWFYITIIFGFWRF